MSRTKVEPLPTPTLGKESKVKKPKLPRKASDGILMALDDLEAAERSPYYEVDMNSWFDYPRFISSPVCMVCLAGAVIARAGQPFQKLAPGNFPEVENKLMALDYFRSGEVVQGLESWYAEVDTEKLKELRPWIHRDLEPYSKKNRTAFKRWMRRMAKELARVGF